MNIMHILVSCNTGGIEKLCVDYSATSCYNNIFCILWGSENELGLKIKENGSEVIELKHKKIEFIKTALSLKKICILKKIDVVVVHHEASISYIIAMFLKDSFPEIRFFIYAHCNAKLMYHEESKKNVWIKKFILKTAIKHSDGIIAISSSVKDSLIKYLDASSEKINIIYNGIDLSSFRNNDYKLHSPIQFIYVGRLVREKGVQNILFLMNVLRERKYDFELSIIGDGPYRSVLESISSNYHLENNIKFLGTRHDVPLLLQNADIFIHLPECEEGFGISIVEAMASGLICICKNTGGIAEIISDNVNGYFITSESAAEFIYIIDKIINNYKNHDFSIQDNAIKTAKHFSIESFSSQLDTTLGGR